MEPKKKIAIEGASHSHIFKKLISTLEAWEESESTEVHIHKAPQLFTLWSITQYSLNLQIHLTQLSELLLF